MTHELVNNQSSQRLSPWIVPVACLTLLVGVILAPIVAPLVITVIAATAIHHAICVATTKGSPVPFAVLLGLDILMIVAIVGMIVSH